MVVYCEACLAVACVRVRSPPPASYGMRAPTNENVPGMAEVSSPSSFPTYCTCTYTRLRPIRVAISTYSTYTYSIVGTETRIRQIPQPAFTYVRTVVHHR